MPGDQPAVTLTVAAPGQPIARGGPCRLVVTLTNVGPTAVTVNRRGTLGYRDLPTRELFAELRDATTGQPVPHTVIDYDRARSPAADYVALASGQQLTFVVDLFAYYRPRRPGVVRLTLAYQADEELASPPATILRGVVVSPPVTLTIDN